MRSWLHASAVLWIPAALGCATTRYMGPVLTPEREAAVRAQADGRDVEVPLDAASASAATGAGPPVETTGKLVATTAESARVEVAPGTNLSIPTAQVRDLDVRDRALGGVEGFGIGALVGAAAGVGAALASPPSECPPNSWGCVSIFSRSEVVVLDAVALGLLLGVVGAVIGARIGHTTHYHFGPPPP